VGCFLALEEKLAPCLHLAFYYLESLVEDFVWLLLLFLSLSSLYLFLYFLKFSFSPLVNVVPLPGVEWVLVVSGMIASSGVVLGC
jgi:hypothetical protein